MVEPITEFPKRKGFPFETEKKRGKEEKVGRSLIIDCRHCETRGERQLGEGETRGICPNCAGKGETELTKDEMDTLVRYLSLREEGYNDPDARDIMALEEISKKEGKRRWRARSDELGPYIEKISAVIDEISISNVPELREFLSERLKKKS